MSKLYSKLMLLVLFSMLTLHASITFSMQTFKQTNKKIQQQMKKSEKSNKTKKYTKIKNDLENMKTIMISVILLPFYLSELLKGISSM